MATKYVLRKPDGTYYALSQSLTSQSKDPKQATLFDTLEDAKGWCDTHAIHCVKLRKMGFAVFKREV